MRQKEISGHGDNWTDLLGPFSYQGLRLTRHPQQINKLGSCPIWLHNTHTNGGKFDSASVVRTASSSRATWPSPMPMWPEVSWSDITLTAVRLIFPPVAPLVVAKLLSDREARSLEASDQVGLKKDVDIVWALINVHVESLTDWLSLWIYLIIFLHTQASLYPHQWGSGDIVCTEQ